MNKTLNLKPFAFHLFTWMFLIFYELTAVYFLSASLKGISITLTYYLLYIGCFYLHSLVILPAAYRTKLKAAMLIVLILAEMALCLALKFALDKLLTGYRFPSGVLPIARYLFLGGWRITWFLILSTVYWLIRRTFRYRDAAALAERQHFASLQERSRLELDMSELRFAFLQQQINPHFLFNALNFIYSSVLRVSPDAAMSVYYLSELTRYGIRTEHTATTVPLAAEEEQLKHIIALNRARFGSELQLSYELRGSLEHLFIVPFVLLTLAENLFKHGNLLEVNHPGRIRLTTDDVSFIKFATWNLKKYPQKRSSHAGIGLANARRRLEHVYGGGYVLDVTDLPDSFAIELTITL